jgi:hypothetical protein
MSVSHVHLLLENNVNLICQPDLIQEESSRKYNDLQVGEQTCCQIHRLSLPFKKSDAMSYWHSNFKDYCFFKVRS